MTRPLRLHAPGVPHHVCSRGNGGQEIFINRSDYQQFLELLPSSLRRFSIECFGYCLMPNHYHLTLQPGPHPISRMMQQLNSAYAGYFNRKHQRVGHVMQGRFQGLIVEADDYLLRLLRYVMRNPVEARRAVGPSGWRWSSYRATAGLAPVPSFLTLEPVWAMFDGSDRRRAQKGFVDFVSVPEDTAPLLSALFFGSTTLRQTLSRELDATREIRDFTYRERYADRPPLDALITDGQDEPRRTRAMQEAFSRHAYTLREIADMVGCHPSTVWRKLRQPSTTAVQMRQWQEKLRA
jgi:REP element-mobilizing transposase RayT